MDVSSQLSREILLLLFDSCPHMPGHTMHPTNHKFAHRPAISHLGDQWQSFSWNTVPMARDPTVVVPWFLRWSSTHHQNRIHLPNKNRNNAQRIAFSIELVSPCLCVAAWRSIGSYCCLQASWHRRVRGLGLKAVNKLTASDPCR